MQTDAATDRAMPKTGLATLIPFLLVTMIWGSTWIVIKDQLGVVPAPWSVAYRFLLAACMMFAIALVRREPLRLPRSSLIFVATFGVLQFVINFNLVYQAERFVTSGLVALIFALLFAFNALLARIFLGQRVSQRFILGSLVAVAGLALLFAQELAADQSARSATIAGIAITLAAVLSASAANVMQAGKAAQALPMTVMLAWSMLFGGLVDAAFAWAQAGPPVIEPRPGYWLGVTFLAAFASAAAFLLYFSMIRRIGPARAAYVNVLVPVVAMGWSTLLEDYRWTLAGALGSAIAMAGMVIALSGAGQSRGESRAEAGRGA